ncbi:MAG TPA: DCC1-like thiol-disulfide oxidoreductase family protein [Parvularculaceae bacterium]|nr:DCC1-like thiol-disulfide oxidoreductase family protein [Parvularculaceae bacterium]
MADKDDIWVVYDGECPFCSAYVRMVRLRKLSNVHLLDAREAHPVVEELKAKGFDLDEGMALKIGDAIYHGDECVHRLALLSGPSGLFNRFNFWVFRNEKRAKAIYPALRAGRNLALRLLGKRRINDAEPSPGKA